MPTDAKLVRGHFLAAAELDAAQRADYLSAHCGDDAAMRAAVERLLAAHDQPARILDQPMVPGPEHTGTYIPPEQPGTLIAGRYKLLEEIGEGGMGTVWVAEQTQPVRRKVALKLIKTGMDSKSVLARFEAERQALAVMDHPNIAKVLDGGLTETGRPFFVMEYVKGVPITQYCDAVRLSIPERLNLFVQVCQAVQHAHQKGIIHRDLKPSNILVAPYDDKPVPKVIDFGLAKAMHQSLTELTLHTAHESVMGTPLYMSPEQAQLNNLDVDTRSDIYSLGVLLYELLTGTTPLEKQRFKQAAWEEMRRLIREEEPPRPSARLSSAQTLPSLAASQHMEPAKLTKLVRGELDWIVMKSLEKDRTRRYETANGFAMDIQRYLAGEPVLAAPPSASYRLRKFARKHRTALTTAAALVLLLVAGVAVSTWQAVRATRAEAAARQAEQDATDRAEGEHLAKLDAQAKQGEAERQKGLADKARQAEADRAEGERLAKLDAQAKQAEAERQESLAKKAREAEAERAEGERAARVNEARERGYAEAITKFVKDDFLALTTVEGQGRFDGEELPPNATLRQLLDRAAEKLKGRKGLAPRTEAELCWIIGVSYRAEEEPALAIPFLERSLELERQVSGLKAVSTLNAQNSLGVAYHRAGQYDRAVPLLEETLKLWQEKFGREHFFTLSSMGNLAEAYLEAGKWDLAMPLLEETLKLRKANGPEQPTTLVSMNVLTTAYLRAGNLDLGRPLAEEALKLTKAKLGPAHPTTLNSMHNRSRAYMEAGKLDLALPLFEETLKLRKANLPPQHPHTLITMGSLGIAYLDTGRLDLAVPLFEDTLKISRAKLGPDHPDTLNFMVCLASGYWEAGKLDLALTLAEETLKLTKIKLGPDHPQTLASMKNLSVLYTHAGKLDVALPLSKETLKLMKAKLGPDHPQTLMSMRNLAIAYQYAGNMDMALPLIEETLKLTKMKLGPDHPQTLAAMDVLASTNQAAGKLDLAVPLFQETLKLRTAKLGPEHPDTLKSMSGLAVAYWQKKQLDKSIPLFEEAVKRQEATLGRNHPGTLANVGNLGVNYKDAGRLKEAIPLLEEAHQAAKQYPALRWVGTQLLDAYAKAGENVKFSNLLQEQLAETRGMPKESAQLANMLAQIGLAYQNAGKLDLALPLLEEALKISKANVGPDHSNTLTIMNDLAAAYWQSKQLDKSIPLFQEALKGREAKLGRDHSATLTTVGNLGVNYKDAGRLKEAIPLLEEAHQAAKKYPALRWVGTQLLDAYAKAGENVKLANLLQEQLAEARQALPKDSPQLAGQLAQIGLVHLQQKQWAEAEPLLRECLDIRAKSQPGVWSTFNTKSMLGGALLGQKKYADAEPLLLAGYEGMKKQEAKIPPQGKVRLTEAVEWLVQLYEATDNPDEAARWREERDAIQAAQKKTQKQR